MQNLLKPHFQEFLQDERERTAGLPRVCFPLQWEHIFPQTAIKLVSKYCRIYNQTMTIGHVVRPVIADSYLAPAAFQDSFQWPSTSHFPQQIISNSLLGHCLWQSPFSSVLGQLVPLLWRATPLTAFLLAQQPVHFIVTRLLPSS